MHILWLSHFLPYPPKGGASQRSFALLREASRRHRVSLVSLIQRAKHPTRAAVDQAVEALRLIATDVVAFPNPSDHSRLRWMITAGASYFHPQPFDVNSLRSRPMFRYIADLARRNRIDVVHVDTVGLMPFTAALPGVPIVLNHHNVESAMMGRRAEREPHRLKRHYFAREERKLGRLERQTCSAVAANLVVSELDAQRVERVSPTARTRVVANGVDTEYFESNPAIAVRPKSLVFAGGMNRYPNADAIEFFVSQIWPTLVADDPDRTAAIVGRNPPPSLVRATSDSRLRAPGFVDDVRPWLDEAATYICPIRDGGGTRLKILDALAMRKPLVATGLSVEGLELVEDVHYLRAETPAEFVGQVRRLETDRPFAGRLAAAGRAFVERHYSWTKIGGALDLAYREAIQV